MLSGIGKDGKVATSLRLAWTQLKINFQAVATVQDTADDTFLPAQLLNRAGFFSNRSQPKSVTHAIALELEERRAHNLNV